jgi:Xaa-Pro dipeptidase
MDTPPLLDLTRDFGVDVERLRRERFARCRAEMERTGTDALVLGREANVRYVTDARRLWLAGARPFGPACVVVAKTDEVHVVANSDEGIPRDVPASNLHSLTWNPDVVAARVAAIPGLGEARTVGVDGWNAAAGRLLARVAPSARIVDGAAVMEAARRIKTWDEVVCLRAAATVADAGLGAVVHAIEPGATEARLRGVFAERVASFGVTIPSIEGFFRMTTGSGEGSAVRPPPFEDGRLAALCGGVLVAGYDGTVARTWPCGRVEQDDPRMRVLGRRARDLRDRLARACRPGASVLDLVRAYEQGRESLPSFAIAQGAGLGPELPAIGVHACDPEARLETGMTLALRSYVRDTQLGGLLLQDLVVVTEHACEVLTRHPYGPIVGD